MLHRCASKKYPFNHDTSLVIFRTIDLLYNYYYSCSRSYVLVCTEPKRKRVGRHSIGRQFYLTWFLNMRMIVWSLGCKQNSNKSDSQTQQTYSGYGTVYIQFCIIKERLHYCRHCYLSIVFFLLVINNECDLCLLTA